MLGNATKTPSGGAYVTPVVGDTKLLPMIVEITTCVDVIKKLTRERQEAVPRTSTDCNRTKAEVETDLNFETVLPCAGSSAACRKNSEDAESFSENCASVDSTANCNRPEDSCEGRSSEMAGSGRKGQKILETILLQKPSVGLENSSNPGCRGHGTAGSSGAGVVPYRLRDCLQTLLSYPPPTLHQT